MLDRRQIHTVIYTLIREASIRSVSDIHITEGMPVWYRIHGCLTQARDVLKEYDIREVLLGMMNEKQRKQFEDGQDVDFAWQTTDGCRQRVNIFCEQKNIFRHWKNSKFQRHCISFPRSQEELSLLPDRQEVVSQQLLQRSLRL